MSLPPLPEGATLDALPPLPEGATLDAQPLEPGNIDMSSRPRVKNADGSISTVRSMSANFDGQEVLIPTVSDDGRVMSDQEALDTYQRTGRHLGKFATVDDANRFAQQLHDEEAAKLAAEPLFTVDGDEVDVGLRLVRSASQRVDRSTLDFSRDPATVRYQQQRAEQEDLVRKAFKAGSEPGVDPDLLDARVATFFDIPKATVAANRQGWLDTYAKASGDPRKWLDENPLSARLVLEHPERADQVVNDKELNVVMKGLNKAIDWFYDLRAASIESVKADRAADPAAAAAADARLTPEKKARIEAQRVDTAAQIAGRAERDAPKPVVERDTIEAQAVREAGPMAIAAQRARESRAQLEVSKLYADLLWARKSGQDTTLLVQRIQEAEEAAKGLKLGETGATQVLSDSWAQAQSTLGVLGESLKGMGAGGVVGGVAGGAVGGYITGGNPAGIRAGAWEGAKMGAKFGAGEEAARASFTFELGDSFKQLLSAQTDASQPLSENEAIGGALIAASIKTGFELAELSLIMKALGPGGAIFEKGGLDAVKAQLATNPGFRALAVKAARAWVGEGVEEVAQGATDDAISFLVRSKHAGQLQAGPVIDVEARKQDFVGGLMAGSIFGAGSLAVSTTTQAVFGARNSRSAALAPTLADLAANPKAQAMAPELANLVTAKTAEQGDEVSHVYVDASAFRRLFQTDQEADAKATELLGEDGPKKLANTDFTGGKLAVPLAEYIAKWGKDDVAKKLADDTATRSDRPTPRELAEQQAADEEFAKRIAAENREPGVSPTLDRFDALEQQLVDSGRMSAETARESLVPLRQTFETMAKRFGQKVEDLFQNVRVQVDDGGKVLLLEARQAHASQRLSAELHQGLTPEQAAERLYVDDHVTSLYTFPAWELMQQESPAKSVATLTLTDIKPVNDSVLGGHDTANALLAHVAPAIAAVDPQAARKGTTFVFRGGQAELARALEGVKALLPEGMQARGAVGVDVKAAMTQMDTGIDAERLAGTLPKERGDTKADLTKLPELERQFAAAAAARAEQEKTGQRAPLRAQVTSAMKAKVAAMSPAEYFRHAYQDARVPGVLSAVAWDNLPRKAHVASIDIKGLKAINALGKQVGDRVLDLFAEVVRDFDGSDFDFAHLSGDEFAAQHDDPVKLQAWLDRIKVELTKRAVPVTQFGTTKRIHAAFRSGIGEKTYGNADRALNAAKLDEKRRASEAGVGSTAGRSDAGAGGGVRQAAPGTEVVGGEGRALHQRRGAAPQGFVEAQRLGLVAQGAKQRLEQDTNGFTDIAAEGTDKVYRIGLTVKANRSTFLHESAHVFLDLFGELAARADAPESVRADWATTLKWFGVSAEQWAAMPIAEQTPFHEKWAVAFEAYLAKGEYPSSKMAGAFQRFRLWMGSVYKRLTQLGTVAPEIAGVFDRLLATDEEIAATKRAMGLKALPRSVLGLSAEQYQAHLDKLAEATSHATQRADFAIARDQLRATESWWKEAHREAKREAAEEYEGLKARKAQLLLRGTAEGLVAFEPIALNREQVEGWVGAERAKGFLLAKDGIHADEVVEVYGGQLGYASGRELVEEVAALPDKEDFVDARADALMVERHPGVLDERQRLRELVQTGMHGSATREWALREWAALTATGSAQSPKLPTAATLKLGAELMAAGMPAGHLGVHAALRAERTAAEAAEKAALRGDLEQALVFKQKQILNMFLFDALREARDEVTRFETHAQKLTKLASRKRLGKASPVYRDAVDLLLSTFGLGEPREGLKGSLDAVLTEVERLMGENGDTVGFDRARLVDRAETLKKDWKELPLEDLRQLERALSNIEAAARNRSTVLKDGKRVAKEEAIAELQASAEALQKRPDILTDEARTFAQRASGYWNGFTGGLLKIERMAEALSGAKSTAEFIKSPWFRYIVAPIQAAKAIKVELYRKHLLPLVEAFEAIPAETRRRQKEFIDSTTLFPDHVAERRPVRRWEVLMMLLHSGNASNLQRLTEGRNITEAQLRNAALVVGVTKEEYAWLQSVWDAAESLKPLSFDLEERDTGIRPEAIEGRGFVTPHGTVRGGYFPAVYDRITQVGESQEVTMAGLRDATFSRPSTSHGHLKQRSEGFSDIISLSPASITRHFNQSIHDLAFREAVKSVGSLVLDEGIQRTLRERLGESRAEQFKVWIQDVARGRGASANDGLRVLAELAGAVRGNIVTAVLGYRFGNAAEDFTSNLVSALAATDLKAASLAAGVDAFARAPFEVREMALSKSPELRSRQEQVQRELARQTARLSDDSAYDKVFNRGLIGVVKEHAFAMNEVSEWSTSTPIWAGAYQQALELELSEQESVAYADAIIRQALVSHNLVDLPTMLRNRGVVGQMLMFAGAFNHFLNQFYAARSQGKSAAKVSALAAARYAGRAAGLSIGLFVVGAVVRGQGPDKDEEIDAWLFRKLVLEGYAQLMPGVGEFANVLAAKRPHFDAEGNLVLKEGFSSVRNNTLFGVLGGAAEAVIKAVGSGDPLKMLGAGAGVLGPVGGVPTIGPAQAASPLVQFITGTGDWRNPLDAASDVLYGRKKDQPFNLVQGAADLVEGSPR